MKKGAIDSAFFIKMINFIVTFVIALFQSENPCFA